MSKLHKLNIVAFNFNGNLSLKKLDIAHFLNEYDVDILLLSETRFKKNNFSIPNYRSYLNTNGRGTAILVKCNLSHHEVLIQLEKIEATAIKSTKGLILQ